MTPAPSSTLWSRLFSRAPSVWIILLLAVCLWFGEYFCRGLWEPDEARYAYVAREMQQTGHWFAPTLHGEPYPDKPPLLFWLMNVTRHLTHGEITSFSARLPSFAGSVMSMWAVTQLIAGWSSPMVAWRTMMILFTSFIFWQEGGWARTDGLLCGCEMMALYFLFRGAGTKRVLDWAGAWAFIGLAMLAKGPIGLAIPIGIFITTTMAVGEKRSLRGTHWFWGLPLCLLPSLIWLGLAWHSHPPASYFHDMFTSKSVGRIIESKGHARNCLYFLWNFPLDFLPWTFLLPGTWLALSGNPLRRRLTAWVTFVIVLFSIPVCKREIYILAAYPAAAMIIAAGWEKFAQMTGRIKAQSLTFLIGLLSTLNLAEGIAMNRHSLPIDVSNLLPAFMVLFVGAGAMVCYYRQAGGMNRFFVTLAATLFFHQIAVATNVFPALNAIKSPTVFASEVDQKIPVGAPLYIYQEQLAILPLYANRPGRLIHDLQELRHLITHYQSPIVVFKRDTWESLAPQIHQTTMAHVFGFGKKECVWVEFDPKGGAGPTDPPSGSP